MHSFSLSACLSLGMTYIVIKTINGQQYRYAQTSYRVGKKVRTKSIYLGPLKRHGLFGVDWKATLASPKYLAIDEDALLEQVRAEEAKYEAMKERFFKEVGLRVGPSNPVPVEKEAPRPRAPAPAPAATPAPSAIPNAPSNAPDGAAGNAAPSEGTGEAS